MFLSDEEILDYVLGQNNKPLIVSNLPQPHDWFSKDSPVQPASLDLHVGAITLPRDDLSLLSCSIEEFDDLVLRCGHTAVIKTQEKLNLPKNLSAFGFPPARLSVQGLLITNPGHVDPGYEGRMHFTVINMAKEDIAIRKGDPIVTLLLSENSKSCKSSYSQRNAPSKGSHLFIKRTLMRLSHDFLNVQERARDEARKRIPWNAFISSIVGVLAVIVAIIFSPSGVDYVISSFSPLPENNAEKIEELEKRIENLQDRVGGP